MSGDESQLAIAGAIRLPLQVVRRLGRLAVLVGAEERDVEIVAGILEVIGIAAEERDGKFRRKHQPDVVILFVFVEVVHRARVQRHHVAANVAAGALLLQRSHRFALRLAGIGGRHARLRRAVHLRGHIGNVLEHHELHARTLGFVSLGRGIEAIFHVVLAAGRQIVDTLLRNVMIGKDESVGRDERRRAVWARAPTTAAHDRATPDREPNHISPEPCL